MRDWLVRNKENTKGYRNSRYKKQPLDYRAKEKVPLGWGPDFTGESRTPRKGEAWLQCQPMKLEICPLGCQGTLFIEMCFTKDILLQYHLSKFRGKLLAAECCWPPFWCSRDAAYAMESTCFLLSHNRPRKHTNIRKTIAEHIRTRKQRRQNLGTQRQWYM